MICTSALVLGNVHLPAGLLEQLRPVLQTSPLCHAAFSRAFCSAACYCLQGDECPPVLLVDGYNVAFLWKRLWASDRLGRATSLEAGRYACLIWCWEVLRSLPATSSKQTPEGRQCLCLL